LNYIVFDLEATCWMGYPPNGANEIIEIGALRFNAYGEDLGTFNRFIKPTVNPILSPFCKSLTNISQEDVNKAQTFPYVIRDFINWGDLYSEDTYLITWGENDKKFLLDDCRLHKIDGDWIENHINLKHYYRNLKRMDKYIGLKGAVAMEGFDFDGKNHRGIYDAMNLSKIFLKYIDEWSFV
jgi:3'-5' exoribonuclease 1